MKRTGIAPAHRLLRQRKNLTQADVAAAARVGRWKIVDLEAARFEKLRVGDISRCFDALDAMFYLGVRHRGAEIDRLLDERHAALVGAFVKPLERRGWVVHVELSFSEYGERGSIDIIGWHAAARALVVVEVKSELASIEGTLRPFDVKVRLAPGLVRERFGWNAKCVGRILVLPEETSSRRAVAAHSAALNTSLPRRSRALRAWLRAPTDAVGGIWFLSDVGGADLKRSPSAVRRVRKRGSRSKPAAKPAPATSGSG